MTDKEIQSIEFQIRTEELALDRTKRRIQELEKELAVLRSQKCEQS